MTTTARALTPGRDLIPVSVSGPPSIISGSNFQLTDRVCNDGDTQTPSSEVRFYLSTDATITVADTFIGSRFLPPLFSTQCNEATTLVFASVPDGIYHIGAIADPLSSIAEGNESNNSRAGGQLGVGSRPDLIVSAVSGPRSATPGQAIEVSATVCNQGQQPTFGGDVAVYAGSSLLGTLFLTNSLFPGQCRAATGTVFAQPGSPFTDGAYDLRAVADPFNNQLELIETNNELIGAKIGIGFAPDLRISALTAPTGAPHGNQIQVTATVCNDGTTHAGFAEVAIYTSADAVFDGSTNDTLLGFINIPFGLSPGSCREGTVGLPALAPPPFVSGAYRLGGIVDRNNSLFELNEANNSFAGPSLNIGNGPDLVLTSITGPSSAQPGQQINVAATVCNYGTQSIFGGEVRVYLSQDRVIDGISQQAWPSDDAFLGFIPLNNSINSGACREFSGTVSAFHPAPFTDGPYYLGGIVDEPNSIFELNEANNELTGERMGLGNAADLVVSAISAPFSAPSGQAIDVTATVCNRGTQSVPFAELSVYLSEDTVIDGIFQSMWPSDDAFLGTIFSGQTIFPGQCRPVTGTVWATAPAPFFEGAYYLGAIADEFNSVFELNETNNEFLGEKMGIGNQPDLVVTALSGPSSATNGQTITVEATICNRGTSPTGSANISIYTSADRVIDGIFSGPPSDDSFLGTLFLNQTLFAGQCRSTSGTVNAFSAAPFTDGPYYLAAIADENQNVIELNEANNIFVGAQLGMGFAPDLVITALSAPFSATHGQGITVQATVCNRGTVGSSGGEISLYTSLDTRIDGIFSAPPPSDDSFLGQIGIPSFLAPGACTQASGFVSAQAGAPFTDGPYYLAAIADERNDLFELNETNNVFVGARMGIGFGPDLVIASITGPFSAMPGQSFNVQVNLCNRGTVSLFGAAAHIYLSADTQIDGIFNSIFPSDDSFIGTVFSSQNLNPGQCRVESATVFASTPAPFLDGPYYLAAIADEQGSIVELNETNNVTVGARMGIGNQPDLVVTSITAPPSGTQGESINISAELCNRGTNNVNFAELSIYLSADTSIDGIFQASFPTDDAFLGTIFNNNTIFAGQCRTVGGTVNVTAPAPFTDGAYYLGAIADEFQSIPELDESNNKFVAPRFGVGSGPDLVVTALSGPTGATNGQSIELTATVCNHGQSPVGSAQVSIYTSADNIIDSNFDGPAPSDDQFLGSLFSNNTIFPGQCRQVSGTVSAFAAAPFTDGAYFLGAIADDFFSVLELNETNNIFVGRQLNIGFAPDLVVTAISAPPSATHGQAIEVEATVCNFGTVFAPAPAVHVYSSADTVIDGIFQTPGPSDDTFMGAISFDTGLNPGDCAQDRELLPAFAGAPFIDGVYFLGAIADEQNSIFELNEANNERAVEKLAIGNNPDLVVTAITGPSGVENGMGFTAQATVCNRGTVTAFFATVFVYLSADPVIDGIFQTPFPSDDVFLGTINLSGALDAGRCRVESATVNAFTPAPFTEGPYYLGAIVDEPNSIVELDETNNETTGARIGVGHRPDLVVTAIEAPPSANHGQSIEIAATVCNAGTTSTNFAEVSLYTSADTVIDGIFQSQFPSDDSFLGTVFLSQTIFPGQCRRVSGQVSATAAAPFGDGAYYLGAIVDEFGSVPELNESNNEFVGEQLGIGSNPDLVVTALIGPPSASFGQQISVQARVCNQGTSVTGGVQVSVYLSADTIIDGIFAGPGDNDGFLGSLFVNDPLQPGACRVVSGDVTAFPGPPFTEGAYYLGAIADEPGSIFELNEENNIFVGELLGVGSRPDLVIRALTFPASAQHGNAINVSATVCNEGTSFASSSDVYVYISADTELDGIFSGPGGEDSFLGTIPSGGLAPGACSTSSQLLPAFAAAPFTDGSYYLGGIVDEPQSVLELNELNNVTIGGVIGIGSRSDLVVEAIDAPPSAMPGQSVDIGIRLCNRGTVTSNNTNVMLYTSADPVIEGIFQTPYPSPDRFLGTFAFNPIAPNTCVKLTGSVSMQSAEPFTDGPYYLGAIADEFNSEQELNETNNELIGPQIGIGSRADLVVTGISAPPSALPGASIAVEVEVCNQGTTNASFAEVSLYVSYDQEIDGIHGGSGPSDDMFLGIFSAGAINAGACVSVTNNVFVSPPAPFIDGAYYLGAIADEFESVPELNEENNEFLGLQIGIGNGPDLILSAVSSEPFVLPSGNFDVSSTACNAGTSAASSTNITYYLSADAVITASDLVIGFGSVPGLAAGTCHNEQVTAFLPGVAVGTYYVGAIVDRPSFVVELNESNNTKAGGTFEVALHFCGNGSVDQPSEQCDDGNNVDGDGCTAACIDEFCGDHVVNNGGIEECDDGNLINWDGCSSSCERENPRFGEVGRVSFNQPNRTTWRTVNLQRTYRNPVVIMEAVSRGDTGFAHLRVRNVTATSFQWQIEEWAYLDGVHGTETANYIVLEAGRRTLEDGTILEAGRTTTNQNFRVVNFATPFAVAPVILTAVNTTVDATPVVTRTRNTGLSSFEVRVQEEEAQVQTHGTETVSWLAIQSGNGMNAGQPFVAARTADVVTDAFFTINFPPIFGTSPAAPVFIGHADRTDSTEPVALRWRNLTNSSVQVNMEEDDSADAEHVHTTEAATYLAWGAPGFVTFQPSAAENPFCNDLLDNDGDQLVDCADPQCLHVSPCP